MATVVSSDGNMISDRRKWCETCGEYVYMDDEIERECAYPDCPMPAAEVRDTGDEMDKILPPSWPITAAAVTTDQPDTQPNTARINQQLTREE